VTPAYKIQTQLMRDLLATANLLVLAFAGSQNCKKMWSTNIKQLNVVQEKHRNSHGHGCGNSLYIQMTFSRSRQYNRIAFRCLQ